MKLCSKCSIEKDLTNFYKHSAICKECRNERTRIYRLNNANLWTRRYEKTKKGFLVRMYRNMTSRVKGVQKDYIHIYQGLDILPKEQFYEFALNNSEFHRLFKEWKDALYERRLCPSIDRIDTKFGYTLGNIQFLTMSENASKTSRRKYK
jgi:acetoin utilization deacetylase AcuC-like enzyme